jgi:NADPH-dependent ferric siderophore reductase
VNTYAATVLGRRSLSAHLVRVTLGGLGGFASTGAPDEYVQVFIPIAGTEPVGRIYTVSDHRVGEIDLDVALHDSSLGSTWATSCQPGDRVVVTEAHGLYAAPPGVGRQLLVADITGLPAVARILRQLVAGQRAEVVVVLTDPADEIPLPSAATVDVTWPVVAGVDDIADAMIRAVTSRDLPGEDRYVWLAGEARASRAVRRRLRRELGWPQSDFTTCGYWQVDAAAKSRRYAEVAGDVTEQAAAARQQFADDEGAYLDALDDIFDDLGL